MLRPPKVAIVDIGLGNLFSIRNACLKIGLQADITSAGKDIRRADAVILPGVGAFADAMAELHSNDLVEAINDVVNTGKPLLGICLGMQLLMTESTEFGLTPGLNFIPGTVRRFAFGVKEAPVVPQISWNILRPGDTPGGSPALWQGTILNGVVDKEFMYFVHSFYVDPVNRESVLAHTNYGSLSYCSVVASGNIVGCQFHPERSGRVGLRIYRNWARMITGDKSFELKESVTATQRQAG